MGDSGYYNVIRQSRGQPEPIQDLEKLAEQLYDIKQQMKTQGHNKRSITGALRKFVDLVRYGQPATPGGTSLQRFGRYAKENPKEILSFATDLAPVLGDVKGAIEATTGKDPITGSRLGNIERILAGSSVLPFVPGQIKKIGRVGKKTTIPSAKHWYDKWEVPEDSWVHGRYGQQQLRDDTVVLGSKDWSIADYYAGNDGSRWMITKGKNTKILDANDEGFVDNVTERLISEHEKGRLPYELDEMIDNYGIDAVIGELKPGNIVDSAGLWDSPVFVEWFVDMFDDVDGIETGNGIVILRHDNFIKDKVE